MDESSTGYPRAVRRTDDGRAVDLLDQSRLPAEEVRLRLESVDAVAEAIRSLRVRGAPAIGVTAALGLALDAASHTGLDPGAFRARLRRSDALLRETRPTAVNLFWALDRMARRAAAHRDEPPGVVACKLYGEATAILEDDRASCRRIGEAGLTLIPHGGANVLTHCNAGALATAGMGTALAPLYVAHADGRRLHVFVDETRPLLQGSRLTAWELARAGVGVTVVVDSVAGSLLRRGEIDLVITGADRIAANGDVANKIGTYPLAVLARHHGVPFYVAAPTSTIDAEAAHGDTIPIEERDPDEVRRGFGRLTAPAEVPVHAPAFDVTPAELVAAIVTERGVLRPPYDDAIARSLRPAGAAAGANAGR